MSADSALLTLPEAARLLGVSPTTAYRQVAESEEDGVATLVPGVNVFKVRTRWRVSRDQLERFLRGGRSAGHGPQPDSRSPGDPSFDEAVLVVDRELIEAATAALRRLADVLDARLGHTPHDDAASPSPPEETITVPEAARLIGVAKSTAYKTIYVTGMIADGVPALKVRGTWRVPRSHLARYLANVSQENRRS